MDDLSRYLKSFGERGFRILESSAAETQRRQQYYVSPEHVLIALIKEEPGLFDETMQKHSIDPRELQLRAEKRLDQRQKHPGDGVHVAPLTTEIFKYSMDKARSENRRVIEASDICHILVTRKIDLLNDILLDTDH
jgi:ATP-dependent Clp protease ATP-binding subunit ClpA